MDKKMVVSRTNLFREDSLIGSIENAIQHLNDVKFILEQEGWVNLTIDKDYCDEGQLFIQGMRLETDKENKERLRQESLLKEKEEKRLKKKMEQDKKTFERLKKIFEK